MRPGPLLVLVAGRAGAMDARGRVTQNGGLRYLFWRCVRPGLLATRPRRLPFDGRTFATWENVDSSPVFPPLAGGCWSNGRHPVVHDGDFGIEKGPNLSLRLVISKNIDEIVFKIDYQVPESAALPSRSGLGAAVSVCRAQCYRTYVLLQDVMRYTVGHAEGATNRGACARGRNGLQAQAPAGAGGLLRSIAWRGGAGRFGGDCGDVGHAADHADRCGECCWLCRCRRGRPCCWR